MRAELRDAPSEALRVLAAVSEAVYLRDPDGNGLELYRDRPAAEWPRDAQGNLAMYTRRLDLQALVG
jgi:catechol 2,3-dioxygenase